MILLTFAVLAIVTLGGVCLWQRRLLWHRPQDRAITIAVLLMPIGVVLIYPDQERYLGAWLHDLTRVWYLNDYLSLLALMVAVCQLVKSVALRLEDVDTAWVTRQVNVPSALCALVMLGLFFTSPITREKAWPGPIMDLPVGSLWGMWFVYAIVSIWCLVFLLWLLLQVRSETDDRRTLNWFIACALTGMSVEVAVIAAQYTRSLFAVRWYGTLAAVALAIIGGLRSWRNRPK